MKERSPPIRTAPVRKRSAKQRVQRVAAALAELPKILQDQAPAKTKKPRAKFAAPRASTRDADARVMKMPDHGFRPAYNVPLAADTQSRAIVGVAVTNARSDLQQAEPMRRRRMGEQAGKPIHSRRASTSETINADLQKSRGLSRFVVQGLQKVRCRALWCALAYNLPHVARAWTG